MIEDKDLSSKLSSGEIRSSEWHGWFINNQERYYRRLFASHYLKQTIDDLKLLAKDALSTLHEFDYNFHS